LDSKWSNPPNFAISLPNQHSGILEWLTRDMVAPIGVCGVNGVFRKTCEKTMEILKLNEKTLTTILEVLLYDPMYARTISTKQAQRRQLESDDDDSSKDGTNQVERNSMAFRVLLKIH